jgi:microcystin-dependent protein
MSCTNCFNSCTDIVSDTCVKYTGVNIPLLNIKTGDTLLLVENSILNYLVSIIDGTGLIVNPEPFCAIINSAFGEISQENLTLNNILNILGDVICGLNNNLVTLKEDVDLLEQEYDLSCLGTVSLLSDSNTHNALQNVINKICLLQEQIESVATDIANNYVAVADINTYISEYLSSVNVSNLISNRMVPFSPIPFIGSLANFDITGKGLGVWDKVYICNGNNSTQDMRGRVIVGATTMGTNSFNPSVDPGLSGNPSYAVNNVLGSNQVSLTNANQLPIHSHNVSATTVISPATHKHFTVGGTDNEPLSSTNYTSNVHSTGGNLGYGLYGSTIPASKGNTNEVTLTAATTLVVGTTGGGQPHNNIQPVIATYYIIYIP